jgi:type IV pilus assembly protein PilM
MSSILHNKSVGISIADQTVEIIELRQNKNRIEIASMGRMELLPGAVKDGKIRGETKLSDAVKEILQTATPSPIEAKKAIFALPAALTFTHVFRLGPHKKEKRDELVLREAVTNIPLKKEDLLHTYRVRREEEGKTEILIVAASKKEVAKWYTFFRSLGITISRFDPEVLTVLRTVLSKKKQEKPLCVVNIRAMKTTIAITDNHGLWYEHIVKVGGDSLTNEVRDALHIEEEQAEEKKKKMGLAEPTEQIFPILAKALEPIMEEVRETIRHYHEKTKNQVAEIIVVGGSSALKELPEYLEANLEIPVHRGHAVRQTELFDHSPSLNPRLYTEAIGAALGGIEKEKNKYNLALQGVKEKEEEKNHESAEAAESPKEVHTTGDPLRTKKIALIVVLIVGVIALGAAFWYRTRYRIEVKNQIKEQFEALEQLPHATPAPTIPTPTIILGPEDNISAAEEESQSTGTLSKTPETFVRIMGTPTGWLNARKGPGTSYGIIKRINPGEEYEKLKKENGWYAIQLDENTEGWISAQYAEIQL